MLRCATRSMSFWFALLAAFSLIGPFPSARGAITPIGDVEPSSPSAWTNSTTGYIGNTASGTLTVGAGSHLISCYGYLGYNKNVSGTVTVTGVGSTWADSGEIYVGHYGSGTLNVNAGGAISNLSATIGEMSGATGVATVDGAGSTWTNSYGIWVGDSGSGTLNITGGGTVVSSGYFDDCVGLESGSTGLVKVDGPGSNWTGTHSITVGRFGKGTLNITGGGAMSDAGCYIGCNTSSTSTVLVSGTGSTWTNSGDLRVGSTGNAALNINGGAVVSVGGTTYVAWGTGSTTTISFGTGGGTLTTASLATSSSQLRGTGTINTRGLIGDLDLTFDSPSSLRQTLNFPQSGQNVTVNLDLASAPSTNGDLGAGWKGNGSLAIRNGTQVSSQDGCVGYFAGSNGTVTVDGAGSMWSHSYLYLGEFGNGTLGVTNGGTVASTGGDIALYAGSTGAVTVDGAGSTWTSTYSIDVGYGGAGNLNITSGGAVSSYSGTIGYSSGSSGTVTVSGPRSTWTNSGDLTVGSSGIGALSIVGGGSVTTSSAQLGNNTSIFAIDVGRGSSLIVGGGTGTISNAGKIRILAGAGVPADGVQYSPISAGTWSGTGTLQAVGGTWDATGHTFTASSVTKGTSGLPLVLDLLSVQRTLIDDSVTGWEVGASFLAKPTSTPLNFTATVMSSDTLNSLQGLLAPGQSALSGWNFSADAGYTPGDPIYFSFKVGRGYSTDDLDLWGYNGTSWTAYAPSDLTYDGTYASFTAAGLSGYAVAGVVVPEPSTVVLLGFGAIGFLVWRRRRKAA